MILLTPINARRDLLRPSSWFWLGVSSFWLFRVLTLRAERGFGAELSAGALVSFGWDLCLAAGLFAIARAFVRPASSAYPRLHAWWRYAALSALLVCDFLMRAADLLYCTLTGAHFNSGAFIYMTPDNLGLLRDAHNLDVISTLCVALVSGVLALVLDGRAYRRGLPEAATFGRRTELVVAFGAVMAIVLPFGSGVGAAEDQSARFVPEAVFLHEWLVWRGVYPPDDDAVLELPHGLLRRFARLGIAPSQPLDARYPLLRAKIDATPFPYARTAQAGDGLPNVVFTLVEQLDHEFVNAFSHELSGLMPQVSALAQRVTMVTNYQSVTQPTIHALVASLCSIHGALPYSDLNHRQDGGALAHTRLSCLPEILRSHGYRTVYIQAGNNHFADTAGFLSAHGFSEVYGREQLEKVHPEREHSHWGVHDDVLVEVTEQKIRELEAQRARDGRPFFVMA